MNIWSYSALVFILAVSSAGPPLPATLTLSLAAVAARHGHDNLVLLCVVATLSTVAGDIAGYILGRILGAVVDRSTGTEWWRRHRQPTSGHRSHTGVGRVGHRCRGAHLAGPSGCQRRDRGSKGIRNNDDGASETSISGANLPGSKPAVRRSRRRVARTQAAGR